MRNGGVAAKIAIGIFLSAFFLHFSFSQEATPAGVRMEKREVCVVGKKIENFPFYVYQDGNSTENNFSASGAMGDAHDVVVDLYNKDNLYSGSSSVKIEYTPGATQGAGWAGLYWQYPANNWGDSATGFDLRKSTKLTFWARGEHGGEVINTFQVGGIVGKFGDTGAQSIGPVTLTKEWKMYSIDLRTISTSITISKENWQCWPFLQPMSRIIGGFCWATSLDVNGGKGITFYLDEIRFEDSP